MLKNRTKGAIRDLTYKYSQYINDEIDKRKSNNNSEGEKIDKINGRK
jgi:hypothetical protein